MPVKIGPKQDHASEQVEQVFLTDEPASLAWLHQDAIEFVQPAFRDHIDVGHNLVTFRIANKIDVQSSGPEQDPGFYEV